MLVMFFIVSATGSPLAEAEHTAPSFVVDRRSMWWWQGPRPAMNRASIDVERNDKLLLSHVLSRPRLLLPSSCKHACLVVVVHLCSLLCLLSRFTETDCRLLHLINQLGKQSFSGKGHLSLRHVHLDPYVTYTLTHEHSMDIRNAMKIRGGYRDIEAIIEPSLFFISRLLTFYCLPSLYRF